MRLRAEWTAALGLTLATLTASACGGAAATTSSAASTPTMASVAVSDKECPPDFAIDDAEDNNNQVLLHGGRSGYWYTFVDKAGSTITPPAMEKESSPACGATSTKRPTFSADANTDGGIRYCGGTFPG